jgi:RimJ/RimL family protein N-acetyltransferase
MEIRDMQKADAEKFLNMLLRLDRETKFMLYEPEERPREVKETEDKIERSQKTRSLLLGAFEGEDIVGFLSAERGGFNRIRHTAYIVVGVLADYRGNGIGTELFLKLEEWANRENITRLELTVMAQNNEAIRLYKMNGFEVEGIKRRAMLVDGVYADEYYMGRLL